MKTKTIRLPPPLSIGYNIVRSLQLEGRLHVPTEGCWPITSARVAKGWGYPNRTDFPGFGNAFLFPPPEPPDLDQKAKKFRIAYYMRTHTAKQCAAVVSLEMPVVASFEITKDWKNPPRGEIPLPLNGDEILGSHTIVILGFDDERMEFIFDAGWGPNWGMDGRGRLPASYFEHRLIDAHYQMLRGPELHRFHGQLRPAINELMWGQPILGEVGNVAHIRELYDATFDEYLGWAIVADQGEWLDVHELFVKPAARKRGNGRRLIRMLEDLSASQGKQLRFWVSFADIDTRAALIRLLRPKGYQLALSPVRWAAYLGSRRDPSKTYIEPPLPSYIPTRPTADKPPSIKEVVAAVTVAASLVTGAFPDPATLPKVAVSEPVWEYPTTHSDNGLAEQAVAVAPAVKELRPGTDEFDRKNTRRYELIEKRVDGHLTDDEEAEFQALQAEILSVTKMHFPRPRVNRKGWPKLKEGADEKSDSPN